MPTQILLRAFSDLLFAHYGHSLLVVDRSGAIDDEIEGLYEHDLRILSRYGFYVHGRPPRLDALSAVDSYSTLGYYVCPPTPDAGRSTDALGLPENEDDRQVVIRVARFVGRGMHEDVEITNYGLTPARLDLDWVLDADFADIIEARSGNRQQSAGIAVDWRLDGSTGTLRFDYQHAELPRGVVIRLTPSESTSLPVWDGSHVRLSLDLGPGESHRLCLVVAPVIDGKEQVPVFGCDSFGMQATAREVVRPRWTMNATRLDAANVTVQRAWDRAVDDVAALALGDGVTTVEHASTAAGIPLYNALFGRDTLTTALQSLLVTPDLAAGALRLLARHVGVRDDDFYDEQPGRLPQQVRSGPLSLLRLMPWRHDYGDYAAPCAFLMLLGAHHVVAGDLSLVREMIEPAKRVLDWIDSRADLDGDGFYEYRTRSPKGQRHQGWKDAGNAVVDHAGRQVEPPFAPCEVQGYVFAAKQMMAEVFLSLGQPSRAFDLYRQADDLKRRFAKRFWMPEERFIAFGLDAEKRQVRSRTSNVGHCLATGILDGAQAADVVRHLMSPEMFTGWGIRTLSADNPAYNPLKYHLGSVWPSENATIALGMMRYGFSTAASTVARSIFDAAALFEHHRLPECFGGHPRDGRHPHPGIYPDACAPQTWSASAVFWLVQAMLGLWTYAPLGVVVVDPCLPDWLPELTLRNLRVGRASVTLRFVRDASGDTDYEVVERTGSVRVLRQPPPNDPSATPVTRVRALVESLLH